MQNITPIEQLPELEDLERENYPSVTMNHTNEVSKYNKFIRNNHVSPQESGMNSYSNQQQPGMNSYSNQQQPGMNSYSNNKYEEQLPHGQYQQIDSGVGSLPKYSLPNDSPTCIDVANHIAYCPICSKFYNNDRTIYIIAIILLSLICILLLKKLLDV